MGTFSKILASQLLEFAKEFYKGKRLKKHISQIELDNEHLMLELADQTGIRFEYRAMKLCLFNAVALYEMEGKLIKN